MSSGVEHLAHEEDDAIAGGLGPHLRAAPRQSFAGQYAGLVAVGDALVLAEEVADFATADADVTRRDVGVLTDMAIQLGHERLAEPHDLAVGSTLRIEIRSALAPADRETGERVFENLFEAEELDHSEVHARVEP
ncbi:Uncharacterised protein [Mycobacteroides abscessus subsp. abscessus]|nr:Uncharacterised protein [Mycobacteroides abscessus subsp. abscessus]